MAKEESEIVISNVREVRFKGDIVLNKETGERMTVVEDNSGWVKCVWNPSPKE